MGVINPGQGGTADVLAIGEFISGSIAQSILYVDAFGNLAQDPPFFVYDDSLKQVRILSSLLMQAASNPPTVVLESDIVGSPALIYLRDTTPSGSNNPFIIFDSVAGGDSAQITFIPGFGLQTTASLQYSVQAGSTISFESYGSGNSPNFSIEGPSAIFQFTSAATHIYVDCTGDIDTVLSLYNSGPSSTNNSTLAFGNSGTGAYAQIYLDPVDALVKLSSAMPFSFTISDTWFTNSIIPDSSNQGDGTMAVSSINFAYSDTGFAFDANSLNLHVYSSGINLMTFWGSATGIQLPTITSAAYLRTDSNGFILGNSTSQGDILYSQAANILTSLAKNTTATRYLSNTGTSNNPAWAQVNLTNGVTGTLPNTSGGTGQTGAWTSGALTYASSTTVLASAAGAIYATSATNLTLTATAANATPLVCKAFSAGQTRELEQWQLSNGAVQLSVGPAGQFRFYNTAGSQILAEFTGDSTNGGVILSTVTSGFKGLQIRATAAQTENLLELQQSTGAAAVYFKWDKLGRPITGNTTIAIAAGAGAGTTPTVSVAGTDVNGVISVTTGTLPTAAAVVATLTYSVAFAATPKTVILTPANANAALLGGVTGVFIDSAGLSTTTFAITAGATGLTASTAYKWYYQVLG